MRKLIAKHPWILVVAALVIFMTVSIAMLIVAILNKPAGIPL
jgi:phage-related holin